MFYVTLTHLCSGDCYRHRVTLEEIQNTVLTPPVFFFFFFVILRIESRASNKLVKCSTTALYPKPHNPFIN